MGLFVASVQSAHRICRRYRPVYVVEQRVGTAKFDQLLVHQIIEGFNGFFRAMEPEEDIPVPALNL